MERVNRPLRRELNNGMHNPANKNALCGHLKRDSPTRYFSQSFQALAAQLPLRVAYYAAATTLRQPAHIVS